MTVAQEVLRSTLFPGHPYQWTTVGREPSVQAISREDLLAYAREHMRAGNLSLAVFGNITPDDARDLVASALREFPSGDRTRPDPRSLAPELPAVIAQDDPSEQGIVLVGYPGIDILDPRNDALSLLQRISSGLSSDLAIDVRDQRGLAYFVGAMSLVGMEPGFYSFYAGTTAEAMNEVAERIQVEAERLRTEGPREEELQRAVEQAVAEHHMGLQNNLTLAQQCAMFELYGLGYRYALDLEDRLRVLTTEDLRQTADEVLDPERQVQVHLKPVGRRAGP